ncbi:histidine kinase [Bacillus sp. TH44]|uniref:histidine kinase n=1 Tax=unclassified Bacillus (in: firmicutes) TaxID=185979 RepID=UPI0019130356|nr:MULTISPECIES: histidine kinase [unclassified Bacillus (in: firmicutes)]MBK5347325.1 histidine kinase [Bacillus sp. TH45]MBK5360984.1 histidine kinase [Bacillus sp. TH44]MBK5365771.1 histidine kinase [Bacillus sp. TH50]
MNAIQFVQFYVMKSAEKIDELYIRKEQGITILPIIKQTPRKIMNTAELLFSEEEVSDVSTTITKNFYSPNVRKRESDVLKWLTIYEMLDCIERGIFIKEVRFEKDGKTVRDIFYRMGYGLFTYMEKERQLEKLREEEILHQWMQKKQSMPKYTNEYTERLWNVLEHIENDIESTLPPIDEKRWSFHKTVLFLEFLLATYKISCEKRTFDWKEIGAAYYEVIGGSKKFDQHKKEFLDQLEDMLDAPPHCLGLVSLGTVTPIFFCGKLQEGNTYYECDTVRSLTDLVVFRHEYKTDAKVLWLVENRAILTRMAAESGFVASTDSLVVGVDGQLRSGHKKFIQSVLAHSHSIKKIMIWTDYDGAGEVISDALFELVGPYERHARWISADGRVLDKKEFEESTYLRESEQEESLGGVDTWMEWISQ